MIEIIENYRDALGWDSYVERHPEGRFCHLYEYRCIEAVYGYRPRYFGFQRGGRLVGVLPAFEARSVLFGRRLLSQPFSEYGGFLLDDDLGPDEISFILGALRRFLSEHQLSAAELHGRPGVPLSASSLIGSSPQQLALLDLGEPLERIWRGTVSRHVRKAVNKARRTGLDCVEDNSPDSIEKDFYPLYIRSMRRLGSLPHPVSYFLECRRAFGDSLRVFWALLGQERIAALLGFSCGQHVSIINTVSDERYWDMRPNDLVHWEFIRWAHEKGFNFFDFGSVRYAGQQQFKSKWGCSMRDSGHFFLLPEGILAAPRTFDSTSLIMSRVSNIWSHWAPDFVARRLGPVLRRNLMR